MKTNDKKGARKARTIEHNLTHRVLMATLWGACAVLHYRKTGYLRDCVVKPMEIAG